jgi:hypothetical protein
MKAMLQTQLAQAREVAILREQIKNARTDR